MSAIASRPLPMYRDGTGAWGGAPYSAPPRAGSRPLLIEKGVFTEAEYTEAMADAMEREADTYRQRIAKQRGVPVTLA